MKKVETIKNYLIFIGFTFFFAASSFAQAQDSYTKNVNAAKLSFQNKKFITAAQLYSQAFFSNHNLGRADHRYDAARCWALGGMVDSAFNQLERSVKGNFNQYLQILTDTAFIELRGDNRWPKLLDGVKINKQKTDEYTNSRYKDLNKSLVATLDTIYMDDQLPRFRIPEIEKKYGWASKEVSEHNDFIVKQDAINREKIKHILDKYGWLSAEIVGEQGNNTLFLVIQHSDLATQLHYLPLIRDALKQGKVRATSFAILEDRMALAQGKMQIYGSQIQRNYKTGGYFVRQLDDPENVDKRRTQVGLSSIKEYVAAWGINWSTEQYKKDLIENK